MLQGYKNNFVLWLGMLLITEILLFGYLFTVHAASVTQLAANSDLIFVPEIPIAGITKIVINGSTIGNYINTFYLWAIRAVTLLAVFMVMLAGVRWITAAGNATTIGAAKTQMTDAIIGLVLILCTNLILHSINPQLTVFKSLNITKISPIGLLNENNIDLELFLLLPHDQTNYNIDDLYSRWGNKDRPNAGKDVFCLYGDNSKNSGNGWAVGGPRGLDAFLIFPDNVKRKAVAIKGKWWYEDDPEHPFSLCKNSNPDISKDGCVNAQEGWRLESYPNIATDYCSYSAGNSCSGISASKADVFAWQGGRKFGDPGISSQHKGGFKIEVTMFSRTNEFPAITVSETFTQTCGVGVEQTGSCDAGRTDNRCCKIPHPSTEDLDFYYDFLCSPKGWQCADLYTNGETDPHKQAVEQPDKKDIYCNF